MSLGIKEPLVPTKSQIIASSAGWIAALLNFLPGLGTGYLYQRRWKAYWITTGVSALWAYFDFIRLASVDPADPAVQNADNLGLVGLIVISSISAYEAAYTVRKERSKLESTEITSN